MSLITSDQREQMLANARAAFLDEAHDPEPVVRLFIPRTAIVWLLSELDPEDETRAFGLCDMDLGLPELGWVSLTELAAVRGPFGLTVERDDAFVACRTLGSYARVAGRSGRIVT